VNVPRTSPPTIATPIFTRHVVTSPPSGRNSQEPKRVPLKNHARSKGGMTHEIIGVGGRRIGAGRKLAGHRGGEGLRRRRRPGGSTRRGRRRVWLRHGGHPRRFRAVRRRGREEEGLSGFAAERVPERSRVLRGAVHMRAARRRDVLSRPNRRRHRGM